MNPAVRVFGSLALRGSPEMQLHQTRAALLFLEAHAVVVHVSQGSTPSSALLNKSRVVLNPKQHYVRTSTATVLGVHLDNLALLESCYELAGSDKLVSPLRGLSALQAPFCPPSGWIRRYANPLGQVMLAANVFLFRPCASHVRNHTLSFMKAELGDAKYESWSGALLEPPVELPSTRWSSMWQEIDANK